MNLPGRPYGNTAASKHRNLHRYLDNACDKHRDRYKKKLLSCLQFQYRTGQQDPADNKNIENYRRSSRHREMPVDIQNPRQYRHHTDKNHKGEHN